MDLNNEEQSDVPVASGIKSDQPKPSTGKSQKPKPVSPISQSQANKPDNSSSNRDTTIPSNHDTVIPRHHDTTVEAIRAAVKHFGKEAATHRFTPEEKQAVAEVVFTYLRQGIRTNENEIARIGVNFLIEDYRQNGENSVLDKVLKALNR